MIEDETFDLQPGDRIRWGKFGQYGTVLSVNEKSVRIVFDDGTIGIFKRDHMQVFITA